MFAIANTALDFLVLQLVLHGLGVGIGGLVLGILAPVDAWSEDDVLTNGGGIGSRAIAIFGAQAELGPCFSVGDTRVYFLDMADCFDATSGLDLLAVVVVAVGDDGPALVLVLDGLGRGKFGGHLLDIVVVGPVVP